MTAPSSNQAWFQTDDAWSGLHPEQTRDLWRIDVRDEARGLRFITAPRRIEAFVERHGPDFRPFTLFGSGDFHHLSAVWTRQFTQPFTILSFDNHPDWVVTPPRWSCGAWINRALENTLVEDIAVWGCGNFECNFPGRLLGNRRAAKAGRLEVFPWAQPKQKYPDWLYPVRPETWRESFESWVNAEAGRKVYVTIDLDCLASGQISTNWEAGLFNYSDIVWALERVRAQAEIIGGDLCGAWSEPAYATSFQRLAGWFDHPKVAAPDPDSRATHEAATFTQLWPALTCSGGERL
jgi:arginase family enzyme